MEIYMSLYVFEDKARKKELKAKDAQKCNKGIRYYCPNPACNAKMFLWSLDGERTAHFQSKGEPGHIEHCPFGSENNFHSTYWKEEDFNADNAIEHLMNGKRTNLSTNKMSPKDKTTDDKSTKAMKPHTIRQIYDMCKAHSCKDSFNNQLIGNILVDNRSMFMYPRGVFGYHLIEAKCKRWFYDNNCIYLVFFTPKEEYEFELRFSDTKLYNEIKNMLYNNREYVIIVAGKWEKSDKFNQFSSKCNCKSQIKVLRQKV